MKRILPIFVVLAFFLVASSAFAGTIDINDQITLGASHGAPNTDAIDLNPTGGGAFSVTFNSNANGAANGVGTLFSSGFYTILQNGATDNSNGLGCGGTCVNLNQSGSLLFEYGSAKGGSNLLTGNLTLVDVSQSVKTGAFNDAFVVNLTITGGSLAPAFTTGNGVVQMQIDFSGNGNILAGLSAPLNAYIHSGSVNPVIPEPTPLLMLGTGLISLAGLVRSKLFRSEVR